MQMVLLVAKRYEINTDRARPREGPQKQTQQNDLRLNTKCDPHIRPPLNPTCATLAAVTRRKISIACLHFG